MVVALQTVKEKNVAPAITVEQLCLGWRDKVAVRDLSGSFQQGGLYAIVGPNGAGKSTLLHALTGQLSPLRGQIQLAGKGLKDIAFLPQQGEVDRSFPITVYDFVAMGAWRRVGPWRRFSAIEHERIEEVLLQVGLHDFATRSISTLSGGQLQRTLFARLMMFDAPVLLLDEPFSAVDKATTDDLMRLLLLLNEQGRTVIAVLHDLEMVRQFFPHTLLLAGQAVAWGETATVLSPENLHLARHLCAGDYL